MSWLLLVAALPVVVLAAYSWPGPRPNMSFGKIKGPAAYGYLAVLAVLLVAFNFAGGMVLTLLFTTFKERIGRLYATDLVGAGLGCVASVGLKMTAGPPARPTPGGGRPGLERLPTQSSWSKRWSERRRESWRRLPAPCRDRARPAAGTSLPWEATAA